MEFPAVSRPRTTNIGAKLLFCHLNFRTVCKPAYHDMVGIRLATICHGVSVTSITCDIVYVVFEVQFGTKILGIMYEVSSHVQILLS